MWIWFKGYDRSVVIRTAPNHRRVLSHVCTYVEDAIDLKVIKETTKMLLLKEQRDIVMKDDARTVQRWSQLLRQPAKVDSPMRRTNHHEDAQTVFG